MELTRRQVLQMLEYALPMVFNWAWPADKPEPKPVKLEHIGYYKIFYIDYRGVYIHAIQDKLNFKTLKAKRIIEYGKYNNGKYERIWPKN